MLNQEVNFVVTDRAYLVTGIAANRLVMPPQGGCCKTENAATRPRRLNPAPTGINTVVGVGFSRRVRDSAFPEFAMLRRYCLVPSETAMMGELPVKGYLLDNAPHWRLCAWLNDEFTTARDVVH